VRAGEVLDILGRSFGPDQGYVLIREMTIGDRGRRADAIALQLYRSRGIHLHGFEVKVSRRDWVNELRSPAKADDLATRCRHFTVVTPQGIVDRAELPDSWGLFEIDKRERLLRTVTPAKLEPQPLDLYTLSLILRRAHESLTSPFRAEAQRAVDEAYQRGLAAGRGDAPDPERYQREDHQKLQAAVRAFEAASGIHLASWTGEARARTMGQAVAMLLEAPRTVEQVRSELRLLAQRLASLASEEELPRRPRFEDMMAAIGDEA
jgi:hypothetical protein